MLSGVPGTGKSTLGRMAAGLMQIEFVDLPDIVRSMRLYRSYDRWSRSYVVDLRKVSNAVGSILKGKPSPALLSTHIAFKPRGCEVIKVVVLRRNPLELIQVLEERNYPKKKVAENVSAELIDSLYADFVRRFGKSRVFQMDVTSMPVSGAAERLVRILLSDDKGGAVDWMSALEKESRLDLLLSYLSRFGG